MKADVNDIARPRVEASIFINTYLELKELSALGITLDINELDDFDAALFTFIASEYNKAVSDFHDKSTSKLKTGKRR